jgi:hypothetical protein
MPQPRKIELFYLNSFSYHPYNPGGLAFRLLSVTGTANLFPTADLPVSSECRSAFLHRMTVVGRDASFFTP